MTLFFAVLILAGAALLAWMEWVEPNRREINRPEVRLSKPLKRPLRILHLSDTHFAGPNSRMTSFFDRLASEPLPDFIFLTGDILDWVPGLPYCLENLSKLRARFGFFAVFGNHDYYDFELLDSLLHNFPGQKYPEHKNDVQAFRKELEKIGVTVLQNETRTVDVDGLPVLVHGLDDPTTGHANLRTTMANFDPAKINILLTHTVDAFLDIGEGEIDLAFSGHSHGGQIRFPGIGPVITHTRMGRKYASGIHEIQKAVCCISRGIHASRFLHLRLLCPPEAILLTVSGAPTQEKTGVERI